MRRSYYSDTISDFLARDTLSIIGSLTRHSVHAVETTQADAWQEQIAILKQSLEPFAGSGVIHFEFNIPRLGKRIDTVAIIGPVLFVIEFKVGSDQFDAHAIDQVYDYALDLKNFHKTSHDIYIVPILVATEAKQAPSRRDVNPAEDKLFPPICSTGDQIGFLIKTLVERVQASFIDAMAWNSGSYCPTPTIVEAAMALYAGHGVEEISRNDAEAVNLAVTSKTLGEIIAESRDRSEKAICFVTGVPGAGKTLVGLNIATQNIDKANDLYSVFLSGNGPLVSILREALARDKVQREAERKIKTKLGQARSEVKAFIQNVHHFRDECLVDSTRPPIEHVALFDEAQRAWNIEQTAKFMQRKKNRPNFAQSEPEFLISCMDRHRDWAVIVCLVGGGQEINTGEAGISEWVESIKRSYPHWKLHISPKLTDREYGAGQLLESLSSHSGVQFREELHLAVSMRSFRAEKVSLFVKHLLDMEENNAASTLASFKHRYPIVLTRQLQKAKDWLKSKARGTERYGIVVSSEAQRLKPHAIDVKSPMDPVHWFLDDKTDVRSSYYLEDVATEFQVQGLELDWACVTWDADFRHSNQGWEHWSFTGDRWNHIRKAERKLYQKNAYRVLLTRARQGMVIVVPEGDHSDPTRNAAFYDSTFNYLRRIGVNLI